MKTTIYADSKIEAQKKLKEKIIFHKIEENNPIDFLQNLFGMK